MSRRWVFDASPLIVLGKIDRLSLVEQLAVERVVPEAVAEEIERGPASDPARLWLQTGPPVKMVKSPSLAVVTTWGLGRGESAAISYTYQHAGFEVVLDERSARTCAQALGLRVRGTLGILLLAKREGHLKRIRPELEALLRVGYRIDASLLQTVLKQAGEG